MLPLQWFVKEVLRRSRTSCSTLQLALYYLHKARRDIRDVVAKAESCREELAQPGARAIIMAEQRQRRIRDAYPSPPLSPVDSIDPLALGVDVTDVQNSPILCGRRMFLASLIAASKFLQDRNYSNRAWAKISGLPIVEINVNERSFLNMMKFELHIGAEDFHKCELSCQSRLTPARELTSVFVFCRDRTSRSARDQGSQSRIRHYWGVVVEARPLWSQSLRVRVPRRSLDPRAPRRRLLLLDSSPNHRPRPLEQRSRARVETSSPLPPYRPFLDSPPAVCRRRIHDDPAPNGQSRGQRGTLVVRGRGGSDATRSRDAQTPYARPQHVVVVEERTDVVVDDAGDGGRFLRGQGERDVGIGRGSWVGIPLDVGCGRRGSLSFDGLVPSLFDSPFSSYFWLPRYLLFDSSPRYYRTYFPPPPRSFSLALSSPSPSVPLFNPPLLLAPPTFIFRTILFTD